MPASINGMTCNFVQAVYRRVFVFLLGVTFPIIAIASDTITMNMRDADIRTVIQWMAETTGKNFVVDPTVQGTITVLSSEPLAPEQAFKVFLQALAINGFSASTKNNMVSIVPAAKASNNHSAVLDSFAGRAGAEKAVHVFSTTNVDAALVATQLQALIGEHGSLSALPNTNTLLIADSIDNIKRIRQLVNRLDQRGQIDVDVIRLKYLDSSDALRTLQALANTDENADKPSLAADARSNSSLLSGTPSQRQRLRDLLGKLDQKQSERGTTEVVFVQYMDAAELVPILQSVTASNPGAAAEQGQASVEVSETANALILTASEPLLRDMKKVISEIDIERQQILLEAIIVEVNDDLVEKLGVQWNTSFTGDGVEAATNFSLGGLPTDSGALDSSVLGEGFTLGYYRNGSLRALLSALDNSSDANLLSTPSVVALDNEQAEILVGSNVPIVSGRQTSAASGTDDPFTTIERHDIGVSLQITPQINQHGGILLDVLQKVESISNSAIAEDLIFDKRSIKTKVNIGDNEVLVLGGLTRQDTIQSVDRVPVLGYIPILGRLFESRTDQSVRSNLMVFIHPRILGKKETRSKISKERYDNIKEQATASEKAQLPLLENLDFNQ